MTTSVIRGGLRLPIVTQVMGLVVVTLVAAICVHASIALLVPPPPPEIYRISEVVSAFKSPETTLVTRNGHSLTAHMATAPSQPSERDMRAPHLQRWLSHELATQMGVSDDDVRIILPLQPGSAARRNMHAMHGQMGPPPWARGDPPHGQDTRPPPPGSSASDARPGPPPGPPDEPPMDRSARPGFPSHGDPYLIAPFVAEVRHADGQWLKLDVRETGLLATWQQRVLLGFLISVVVLGPIAYLFARWLAAPITAFARAADQLGRNPASPPLDIKGPAEVTVASAAFNQMQDRIRRYVEDRTAMIGSVAHDLRTPLTRIRFRIEQAPDGLRDKLSEDIDEMEAIISATLAFVRDASQSARHERIDFAALVGEVVGELAETGTDVVIAPGGPVMLDGDRLGLRRVTANLIQNAAKFGERARVRVWVEGGNALLDVDDDGPGVNPEDRDRLFEPFVRIEPSRNRATGGAGLGLAVVRTIARAHGGDASLANLDSGGLRARVTLPLPAEGPSA